MNDICEYMVEELKNVEFISLKYNLRYLSLANSIKESNGFNADIHLALHSNKLKLAFLLFNKSNFK